MSNPPQDIGALVASTLESLEHELGTGKITVQAARESLVTMLHDLERMHPDNLALARLRGFIKALPLSTDSLPAEPVTPIGHVNQKND